MIEENYKLTSVVSQMLYLNIKLTMMLILFHNVIPSLIGNLEGKSWKIELIENYNPEWKDLYFGII